jgi:hypothetical protein
MTTARLPSVLLEVRRTLRPGDPGTHKLVQRFGDQLVCVRYRYDAETRIRMTTVELVVDTALAEPRKSRPTRAEPEAGPRFMFVRIAFHETGLRTRARAAGGRWLPERRLWELPAEAVAALGLRDRVVGLGEKA